MSLKLKVGEFLFKKRSLIPIPLIILIIKYTKIVTVRNFIFGLFVAMFGELIRLSGVAFAGGSTRTRNAGADSLVAKGPFRYVRNPLYIGNYFIALGISTISGRFFLNILTTIFYVIHYYFIIKHEESKLTNLFGKDYENYKKQVPRIIPQLTPCEMKSEHKGDFKMAVKSDKYTLINIFIMVGFLMLKLRTNKK